MIQINPLHISIWEPIVIHGYGIMLLIALTVFYRLTTKKLCQQKLMSLSTATELVARGTLVGIVGARLLHVIEEPYIYHTVIDIVTPWHGGLSILGAIIAAGIFAVSTLKYLKIPLLPVLDCCALYAPLAHALGRLGCLWAGCCFGCPTESFLSIQYTGLTAGAPINIMLHPTPLYSAFTGIALFIFLRWLIRRNFYTPGLVAACYLIGMGLERFSIDFLRDDRIFLTEYSIFSFHQWLAL